ncbi:MAG: dTDP-glucose 4,6-dehydratase, partial [Muribaculaceae bacterium]|nr:dTDP-glucose 4,6-dehydratase [Muribaculaceae bacterium]
VLDALTYAGNIDSLRPEIESGAVTFVHGDICDSAAVDGLFERYRPDYVVNFAAESHVDRSVDNPRPFVETNVLGAQTMLECARQYLKAGGCLKKFVHVSTDEVYGDLSIDFDVPGEDAALTEALGRPVLLYGREVFSENCPLRPSSPYSAAKASADMIALSYHRTFGFPVVITRCSNNYGPYQFPEKLIPLMINNILEGRPLPVYGRGLNVRDWIHVEDHCAGVLAAAVSGRPGEVYNFGGYSERTNIDIVRTLIAEVCRLRPDISPESCRIEYVGDRPGHDLRYAINAERSMAELGWRPRHDFEQGLRSTVEWYIANRRWVENIVNGEYRLYYDKMYSNR